MVLLSPTLRQWAPVTLNFLLKERLLLSHFLYILYHILRNFSNFEFLFPAEGRSLGFYPSLIFYIYYNRILRIFQIFTSENFDKIVAAAALKFEFF